MSDDPREPVIDALLEELLGGVQPPDLTQQILDNYEASDRYSIDVRLGKASTPTGDVKTLPRRLYRELAVEDCPELLAAPNYRHRPPKLFAGKTGLVPGAHASLHVANVCKAHFL